MQEKKSFLDNLTRNHYLQVIKSLPALQKEKAREYTTLILTFFALSFFTFFAISPTLATIADLRKQVADNRDAENKLQTKIQNLYLLQQQYSGLTDTIPRVLSAVPKTPLTTTLMAQVQSLAQKNGVALVSLQSNEVEVFPIKNSPGKIPSFTFTVVVQGSFEQLLAFLTSFINYDRIVTLDSVSFSTDIKEAILPRMSIRGRAYFLP